MVCVVLGRLTFASGLYLVCRDELDKNEDYYVTNLPEDTTRRRRLRTLCLIPCSFVLTGVSALYRHPLCSRDAKFLPKGSRKLSMLVRS
jgi:hypothetical protein